MSGPAAVRVSNTLKIVMRQPGAQSRRPKVQRRSPSDDDVSEPRALLVLHDVSAPHW